MDSTRARTVAGRLAPPGRPGDEAQMLSAFGADPNAELMDSTRARTVAGGLAPPGRPGDEAQMLSAFGADPNAELMDSTRARTVAGGLAPPGRPGDEAQMLSAFGADPNAELMDSTRARTVAGGLAPPGRPGDEAQMLSAFGADPNAELMDSTRARTVAGGLAPPGKPGDEAQMLSAFGADPNAELMDSTQARTVAGGLAPPGRPGDEAQMLSAFGADPNAELMDSTRARTVAGGLAPPGRPGDEAQMLSAFGADPNAELMDVTQPPDTRHLSAHSARSGRPPPIAGPRSRTSPKQLTPPDGAQLLSAVGSTAAGAANPDGAHMMTAFGRDPLPNMMSSIGGGHRHPATDAQMMSVFRPDPSAQLMGSGIRGGTPPPGSPAGRSDDAEMMSGFGREPSTPTTGSVRGQRAGSFLRQATLHAPLHLPADVPADLMSSPRDPLLDPTLMGPSYRSPATEAGQEGGGPPEMMNVLGEGAGAAAPEMTALSEGPKTKKKGRQQHASSTRGRSPRRDAALGGSPAARESFRARRPDLLTADVPVEMMSVPGDSRLDAMVMSPSNLRTPKAPAQKPQPPVQKGGFLTAEIPVQMLSVPGDDRLDALLLSPAGRRTPKHPGAPTRGKGKREADALMMSAFGTDPDAQVRSTLAKGGSGDDAEMMSAFGTAPDAQTMPSAPGPLRPGDDAEMMSAFGPDPAAQMLDGPPRDGSPSARRTSPRGTAELGESPARREGRGGSGSADSPADTMGIPGERSGDARRLSAVGRAKPQKMQSTGSSLKPEADPQMMSTLGPSVGGDPQMMSAVGKAPKPQRVQSTGWKGKPEAVAEMMSTLGSGAGADPQMMSAVGKAPRQSTGSRLKPEADAGMTPAPANAQATQSTRGHKSREPGPGPSGEAGRLGVDPPAGAQMLSVPGHGAPQAQMMSALGRETTQSTRGTRPGPAQPGLLAVPAVEDARMTTAVRMMSAFTDRDASDTMMMDNPSRAQSTYSRGASAVPPGPLGDDATVCNMSFGHRDASDAEVMDSVYRAEAVAERPPQEVEVTGHARPQAQMLTSLRDVSAPEAEMMTAVPPAQPQRPGGGTPPKRKATPKPTLEPRGGFLAPPTVNVQMMSEVGERPGEAHMPDALMMSFMEGPSPRSPAGRQRSASPVSPGHRSAGGLSPAPQFLGRPGSGAPEHSRIRMMSAFRDASNVSDVMLMDDDSRPGSSVEGPK